MFVPACATNILKHLSQVLDSAFNLETQYTCDTYILIYYTCDPRMIARCQHASQLLGPTHTGSLWLSLEPPHSF